MEGLEGEDNHSVEDILDMEVDELDSDDDMSSGLHSCLELDRKAEPWPVLETANRVKEDF